MGAGKSTIGKNLASIMGVKFIDLDRYIESRLGKTISVLFAEVGMEGFRRIEHDELVQLLKNEGGDIVLSLGGGTVTSRQTADIVLQQTECVYLKYDVGVLYRRLLKKQTQRPLLAGKSPEELNRYITETFAEREPHYLRSATFSIDCNGKSISQICNEIAGHFNLG